METHSVPDLDPRILILVNNKLNDLHQSIFGSTSTLISFLGSKNVHNIDDAREECKDILKEELQKHIRSVETSAADDESTKTELEEYIDTMVSKYVQLAITEKTMDVFNSIKEAHAR